MGSHSVDCKDSSSLESQDNSHSPRVPSLRWACSSSCISMFKTDFVWVQRLDMSPNLMIECVMYNEAGCKAWHFSWIQAPMTGRDQALSVVEEFIKEGACLHKSKTRVSRVALHLRFSRICKALLRREPSKLFVFYSFPFP